ncbi:MAG TPA: hypothetical protein VNL36_00025 [Bacteroidota bacterium]|nr:hypothetical protein [Bacteroidota bacterium]
MKSFIFLLVFALFASGCDNFVEIDRTPPAAPRGIRTVSLDNAVEITWLPNTEPDIAGYKIWTSDRYDGRYQLIGDTRDTRFVDRGARNGTTYYYALSAYDIEGNESELSDEEVYDTPRPEGYGVRLSNYRTAPSSAGYDFSTYSVGRYDDEFTDLFFENFNGRYYLNVWNDTDIQDMGYTRTLDEISVAPTQGWSPSKSAEAIVGHTYVIWTWDDHYAKVRVREVNASQVVFDWAYQTAKGNPELKRAVPPDGKRDIRKMGAPSVNQ